jgi:tRNA A-37 threonylcarbamoyl transferase component Bud32
LPFDAPEGLCPSCLLRAGRLSAPEEVSTTAHPGVAAPTPAELAPLFPHLDVLELLGQGGMGAVYKARHRKLDRLIALKVLPAQSGRDPAFAERFTREARALARLSHPHIVAVHDFGEAAGLFYLVMEYVDGVNLRQAQAAGRLRPQQVLPLIGQICEALQYAHEQGVVHRDIKPENILLDRQGRIKIADFGLAKLLGHGPALTLTGSQQVMGTPHYMAPEQMDHPQAVDHRADIYSLGVVFYELLTGELPLGRFAPPSRKAPVDGRLDEVVLRALERDPACRYQRVSDVKTAVEALGQPAPAVAEVPAAAQDGPSLNQELLALAGLGAGLGLLTLLVWLTGSAFVLIGLPLLAHAASLVAWRPSLRSQAVLLLAFGGGTFLLFAGHILSMDFGDAHYYCYPVGFWAGAVLLSIWRREPSGENSAATADSPEDTRLLAVLRRFRSAANLYVVPDIPPDYLRTARRTSKVPPEERALALLDFTDDGDNARQNLLFGSAGLYFHVEHKTETVTGSVRYDELARRTIVNHGTEVYLGGGPALAPPAKYDTVDCETIAGLLNALKEAVRARATPLPEAGTRR